MSAADPVAISENLRPEVDATARIRIPALLRDVVGTAMEVIR